MITITRHVATEPGPRLLVTGAIHGNEKCGTVAIQRVLHEIETQQLVIERGSAAFIPICNPSAYAANTRFVERNLNRYFLPQTSPVLYEARLVNSLCPLIAAADAFIDLHSYSSGGPPFAFVGPEDDAEYAFANCLGATALITGWETAYAASNHTTGQTDPDESIGTTEYARMHGAMAVTLECGQHNDPAACEVAYQAIRNGLAYLGMAASVSSAPSKEFSTEVIDVKRVFWRENGGTFTRDWHHLQPILKTDIIAHDADGRPVMVPDDGYMIMPDRNETPKAEWFYWGQRSTYCFPTKPSSQQTTAVLSSSDPV